MTDEFKIILSQFNRLPLLTLKVASCAINCDDTNDHRKYVKKNKLSCTLLSDPTRKVRGKWQENYKLIRQIIVYRIIRDNYHLVECIS